jgi:serine/threonine-protein kinase RsbT
MADEIEIEVAADIDVMAAHKKVRALASTLEFSSGELALIATAISELARNIVLYAAHGVVVARIKSQGGRRGIEVTVRDDGPGIPDVAQAMEDGYSTSGGLGLGLPGAKRLMDDFEIVSVPGHGTSVRITKWETV